MGDGSTGDKRLRALMDRSAREGWQALQASALEKAEAAYEKAVEAARKLAELPAQAMYLSYLGLCRQGLGSLDQARKDLESSLALATESGMDRVRAQACLLLGEQDRASGDADSAIRNFLTALSASLGCQDEIGVETAFGNLGLLYLEKGWAEQASECFRQALERGSGSPNRAAWLGSLGQCMAELGQFDRAVEYYRQAHGEARAREDVVAQAICLGSEGNAHFEQGDFERAAQCYREALSLSQSAADEARVGIWLGNLSNAYRKLGDIAAAIGTCEEALAVARDLGDAHSEAAHLDSLGECHMSAGNLETAMEYYELALELSREIADRQGQRIYLSNLGRVHHRLGQLEPAFECLSRAIDLFDEQRARIKSDDLKTSFAARGQDLYSEMVNVCLATGRRVEALEYVGRAKSRAILDLLSNSPIDVSELVQGEDESLNKLVVKEAQLRNQIARLERLFWQGRPGEGGARRGAAVSSEDAQKIYSQWRETIDQLRRRHPNYANLIAVDTLTFAEIRSLWEEHAPGGQRRRALLEPSVAVLEFYWTDQYFMAAAVFKSCGRPHIHVIREANVLASMRADLADFLVMSSTEGWDVPQSLCKRLYESLMAPLIEKLPPGVDRLILVPHGSLYRLPFSALNDGRRYLVERYALSYLPTTSLIPVLARQRSQPQDGQATPKYLVSAISDYSATRREGLVLSSRLRSAAGLEDLSYTLEEARTVLDVGASHTAGARLLTNQEVKESLPQLFGEYPVIHFAGHAVFNPVEPLASGLVLADGSMLTASAILQGHLLRTRCGKLLVLSACQTGVNMVTPGGEILGLARALMYAGMPNLILSLWEVADRSTSDLMKDFHRAWQAGKVAVAAALREAQKAAAAAGQPVHAWAPFIHLGID